MASASTAHRRCPIRVRLSSRMACTGLSRPVDHSVFRWRDPRWRPAPLSSAIIYECHVGTFTAAGTFDAAIERLGYLSDLGITHVELMPVSEFPGDARMGLRRRRSVYAPHHAYGGPDAMKRLVDAAHGHGLGVILDVVYNHFGPAGNFLPQFGPYLTDRYRTPWGDAVNFDDAGQRRSPAFFLRQRADVAARLSCRRPAARRGTRDFRRLGDSLSRAA